MSRSKIVFRVIAVLLMFLLVQQVGSSLIGAVYYLIHSNVLEDVVANPELAQNQEWLMGQMATPEAMAVIAGFGMAIGSALFVILMRVSRLAFRDWQPANWQCVLWGVLLIIPFACISNIFTEMLHLDNTNADLVSALMKDPWGIVSIALAGPVAEEVAFRCGIMGLFMKVARDSGNPRFISTGLVLQAVLFGVIHLNPHQIIFATILGWLLGFVYYRTGSIVPCIVMHVLNNSSAIILTYIFPNEDSLIALLGGQMIALAVCALCAVAIWLLFTRYLYYPPIVIENEENNNK